jgi:hypothetical protein
LQKESTLHPILKVQSWWKSSWKPFSIGAWRHLLSAH